MTVSLGVIALFIFPIPFPTKIHHLSRNILMLYAKNPQACSWLMSMFGIFSIFEPEMGEVSMYTKWLWNPLIHMIMGLTFSVKLSCYSEIDFLKKSSSNPSNKKQFFDKYIDWFIRKNELKTCVANIPLNLLSEVHSRFLRHHTCTVPFPQTRCLGTSGPLSRLCSSIGRSSGNFLQLRCYPPRAQPHCI